MRAFIRAIDAVAPLGSPPPRPIPSSLLNEPADNRRRQIEQVLEIGTQGKKALSLF